MYKNARTKVVAYLVPQLILTLVVSTALLLVSVVAAYSALVGGLIAAVTTAWFAFKVFSSRQTNEPVVELQSFYLAEMNKIILTGAMFIAVFVLIKPVNGAALLVVYFLVYITPVVVDYIQQPKRRRET